MTGTGGCFTQVTGVYSPENVKEQIMLLEREVATKTYGKETESRQKGETSK
jgi:hypothetical protein